MPSSLTSYPAALTASRADPAAFWAAQAAEIAWFQDPQQVLNQVEPGRFQWFADGLLNTSYLALDHHVATGHGEVTALIWDSPVTDTVQHFSYRELRNLVAAFAGGLRGIGVGFGDRVIIYMPNMPEAVIAMLACARLGAVHSVVFGGFAPHELAVRIDDCTPTVIVAASGAMEQDRILHYLPLIEEALRLATHQPAHLVVCQRGFAPAELRPGRDLDYATLLLAPPAEWVPVAATDPLYILYTSGTTGKPKGVVRENGGHAVALNFSMRAIYGMAPGEVFWAASDIGWAVGHSYIVYAPLLAGCTTVLYEGKPVRTPDAGAFWRVVSAHRVRVLFTAPTAIRAIKKEDPTGVLAQSYDLSSLRYLFLAGERCDPATYDWAADLLHVPVIDHWWQTESGWPMLATCVGLADAGTPQRGAAGVPVPGYDVQILTDEGQPAPVGTTGLVVVKLPLPPGMFGTLWRDDDRFRRGYLAPFPGYYFSGDGGYCDANGRVFLMGRVDDVINVAGHRLSTGEMEEMLAAHPAVAECAVLGIADELRGQVPVGLVVLKDGQNLPELVLEAELVAAIRAQIGAVACFRHALIVKRLPKTRSGKILRKTLRQLADGEPFAVPATIDDPEILAEIRADFVRRGLGAAFQTLL